MGRSCEELLSRFDAPRSPEVGLLLAQTQLRHGNGEFDQPGVHAVGLIRFLPKPIEFRRMRVLGATVTTGRTEAHALTQCSWRQEVEALLPVANVLEANLVFAPASAEVDVLPELSQLVAYAGCRIAVVSDRSTVDRAAFDGVVIATTSIDSTAAVVFKLLANLLAPETTFCLETRDVLAVFSAGQPARICEATWIESTGKLVFPSAQDLGLLESARVAVVSLPCESHQESRAALKIVSAIRRQMNRKSDLLISESIGFFVSPWPANGARAVSILCSHEESRSP